MPIVILVLCLFSASIFLYGKITTEHTHEDNTTETHKEVVTPMSEAEYVISKTNKGSTVYDFTTPYNNSGRVAFAGKEMALPVNLGLLYSSRDPDPDPDPELYLSIEEHEEGATKAWFAYTPECAHSKCLHLGFSVRHEDSLDEIEQKIIDNYADPETFPIDDITLERDRFFRGDILWKTLLYQPPCGPYCPAGVLYVQVEDKIYSFHSSLIYSVSSFDFDSFVQFNSFIQMAEEIHYRFPQVIDQGEYMILRYRDKVEVVSKESVYVQEIATPWKEMYMRADEHNPFVIYDKDINYDGYLDMGLWISSGSGGKNNFYDFYIFDSKTNTLVLEESLQGGEGIIANPEFDMEKRTITSSMSGPGEWVSNTYVFNGFNYEIDEKQTIVEHY